MKLSILVGLAASCEIRGARFLQVQSGFDTFNNCEVAKINKICKAVEDGRIRILPSNKLWKFLCTYYYGGLESGLSILMKV